MEGADGTIKLEIICKECGSVDMFEVIDRRPARTYGTDITMKCTECGHEGIMRWPWEAEYEKYKEADDE